MPASALLLGVSIASLNLCTDEYLLLLARPGEIASVSFLSKDPLESPLWRAARRHHSNRGSIEEVLARRPDLVLTMGGGGRATKLLAPRLGLRSVELTPAASIEDVGRNLHRVALALGQAERAAPWLMKLKQLQRTKPSAARDAIWFTSGGQSLSAESIGASWLRLAGLRQRALPASRFDLETLIARPPEVLVRSKYRAGQMSAGVTWLHHPILRASKARQIATDGRSWTCMGPLMIGEVERLREALQ